MISILLRKSHMKNIGSTHTKTFGFKYKKKNFPTSWNFFSSWDQSLFFRKQWNSTVLVCNSTILVLVRFHHVEKGFAIKAILLLYFTTFCHPYFPLTFHNITLLTTLLLVLFHHVVLFHNYKRSCTPLCSLQSFPTFPTDNTYFRIGNKHKYSFY